MKKKKRKEKKNGRTICFDGNVEEVKALLLQNPQINANWENEHHGHATLFLLLVLKDL